VTKTITLKYKNGEPINVVADYMLTEKANLIDKLDDLELVTGAPTVFGSGEDTIITIKLSYTNPTESDLADINEIISIAKRFGDLDGASDIEIDIDS